MAPTTDISKPDDQFTLVGASWPSESESAYHSAKMVADDASTATSIQSLSASDAAAKMVDERGETAGAVGGGYGAAAGQLGEQSIHYNTVSAWMSDAEGKVTTAKRHIRQLVRAGTSEIREALTSEVSGTAVSPSSSELTAKYQGEIASVKTKLTTELDSIGHSLAGDSGSSRTPSYVSVSTKPTVERPDPHVSMSSYTGTPGAPAVEPHQLPPMPRATSPSTTEAPSATSTPATSVSPHSVNPTLSNLISGGQSASPSGTPSAKSPSATSGTPAGQAHQSTEPHQAPKSPALPRIPSIPLPGLPSATESIATAVSSATASQLPTAPTAPAAQVPASTGITPGTSGAPPMTPAPPAGLSPVGGLTPPPVVQPAAPAPQGTPPTPAPGVQAPAPAQQATAPAAPRGPVADLAWIQKSYGLSPSLDLTKSETAVIPALFITELPEPEATLHRVLATLRHQFESAGWSQPLAVARIKRGFETRLVYVTSDGLSIHPSGILLPAGVTPLDEMPGTPVTADLSGSLMVTDKLRALIPRGWEVEAMLSTVPGGEASQSIEQFQSLVEAGELLGCKLSRGRDDVGADEALSAFARAAIGSGGVGELDAEAARIRASRWVGVQPQGYLDSLARFYLSDAAESMSQGSWGEAVYSSEKYMSVNHARSQAA